MKTSILLKYLKIAKNYASSKEENDYKLLSNVLVEGSESNLRLTCCDGASGIEININDYDGSKILGNFCVNIFDLYNIISSIVFEQDLEFILFKSNIEISGNNFVKRLPIYDSSNIYNIPSNEEWLVLNQDVINELELSSSSSINNDSYSISCQDNLIVSQIYYGLFLINLSQNIEFISYKKYISKIFIEEFTHIALTDNRICFRGNNIKLFIPRVNENKKNVKMVLDWISNNLDNEFELLKMEIIQVSKILNSTGNNAILDDYASFKFINGKLFISSLDTEMNIPCIHIIGEAKEIEIKIPKNSLKILEKIDSEKIKIKLSENNNKCIYYEGGKMKFVGNLIR